MLCRILVFSVLFALLLGAFDPAIGQQRDNQTALLELSRELTVRWQERRTPLYWELLRSTAPPNMYLNEDPGIQLMFIDERGMPVYFVIDNIDAARTISTNQVWPGGAAGFNLTGSGTLTEQLAIWDGGGVLTTHREFCPRTDRERRAKPKFRIERTGELQKRQDNEDQEEIEIVTGSRVTQMDGSPNTSDHSTHVAGTMVAAGFHRLARGMSYEANLSAYDWDLDDAEMAAAAAGGLQVSNHSYGRVAGWRARGSWYWYGDLDVSSVEDYGFGFYGSLPQTYDQISYGAPHYLIVKSAGNNRNDVGPAPGSGHYHSDNGQWVWATDTHDPDGGSIGYDCIPWRGNAKNILTVGAVHDIWAGYSQPSDVVQTTFSGWGPADDGRIKPDIVANGFGLFSCSDSRENAYVSKSGTSMSTPSVSGSVNLLCRHFETVKEIQPRSATMKAIVLQTADEAGSSDGPDYQNGWGLMNTQKAAELIASTGAVIEDNLADGQTDYFHFTTSAVTDLRLTVVWTDPAGVVPPASLDPATPVLVNDLDLRVEHLQSTTQYAPWILDPLNPSSPATTGDNDVDNVERIDIRNAPPGQYRVTVTHKNSLASGSQDYSIACSRQLGVRLYVDADATGAGDGSSWTDAFTQLRDALGTAAVNPLVDEIWVAEGAYTPTAGADRSATFQLVNGLAVYGGFTGGETMLEERDWAGQETILSGDIGVVGDDSDNSHHVVTASGTNSTPVLDGFTVTGGHADASGGGLYIVNGNPTLANLTIVENYAEHGGGIYIALARPLVANVTFRDNSASLMGGAAANFGGMPEFINVTFLENSASFQGGGMVNAGGDAKFVNVVFSGNSTGGSGGALHNYNIYPNTPTISYSIIEGGLPPNCIDGGGNIEDDPLFVDASTGDLRLQSSSPAIDAGDNDAVPEGVTTDPDGNPRIYGTNVDMGAYEYQGLPVMGVKYNPGPTLPKAFALYQNSPNPFNPTTVIRYDVPDEGTQISLRIYDVTGRLIRTLVDGSVPPGQQSVTWDGVDGHGNQVSTGIYFYRLQVGGTTLTKKMVLLK
jgi:hypothetical protein